VSKKGEWIMRTKTRLLTLALAACTVFGSSAYASDVKIMAGAACQPRSPQDRQDIFVLLDGVTNTNPTDPAFVLCPIVRDNTSPSPNGVLQVNLQVRESSNGELVSCILETRRTNGTELEKDEAATDSGNLSLAVLQTNTLNSYHVLQCNLPPGSGIITYRYVEPSPTDRNN
jgi:hypothetical protein